MGIMEKYIPREIRGYGEIQRSLLYGFKQRFDFIDRCGIRPLWYKGK
jgi:hypothetical protein